MPHQVVKLFDSTLFITGLHSTIVSIAGEFMRVNAKMRKMKLKVFCNFVFTLILQLLAFFCFFFIFILIFLQIFLLPVLFESLRIYT